MGNRDHINGAYLWTSINESLFRCHLPISATSKIFASLTKFHVASCFEYFNERSFLSLITITRLQESLSLQNQDFLFGFQIALSLISVSIVQEKLKNELPAVASTGTENATGSLRIALSKAEGIAICSAFILQFVFIVVFCLL